MRLAERIAQLDRLETEAAALSSALAAAKETLARQQKDARRLRAAAARETMEARAAGAREAARLRAEWENTAAALEVQRALTAAALLERDRILGSAAWRLTRPLRMLAVAVPRKARHGARAGLKLVWWTLTGQLSRRLRLREEHFQALKVSEAVLEGVAPGPEQESLPPGPPKPAQPAFLATEPETVGDSDLLADPPAIETVLDRRFPLLRPLPIFPAPSSTRRLSIVLDSLDPSSLWREAVPAIVLGALLADRSNSELRLVARMEPPVDPALVEDILAINGIAWKGNLECVDALGGPDAREVAVGSGDRFLAASWTGAWSASRSLPLDRLACLVHDEGELLASGDEQVRRHEAVSIPGLRSIVRSAVLQTMQRQALAGNAIPFDLAFPQSPEVPQEKLADRDGKLNFILWGDPDERAALYWRALEALALAMQQGVLDPKRWDFTFVGSDGCDLSLPFGVRPTIVRSPSPREYSSLMAGADLGLHLTNVPRLGYGALALAAAGGVVVSSPFDPEASVASDNILPAGVGLTPVVEGLRRGEALAADLATRRHNYERSRIQRDWSVALAPALDALGRWFDD